MKLTLGNITVEIPGPVDAEAAERAADEVNKRLTQAEASSSRIDTMGDALRTAHSLAMDLERVNAARETDATEMAKALQRITDTLQDLVENLALDEA